MKPIDAYAEQANREVGRYYGQRMSFTEDRRAYLRCQDWFKAHWQRFPWTSPDGGKIIDNETPAITQDALIAAGIIAEEK
jgi:hypothetical protein